MRALTEKQQHVLLSVDAAIECEDDYVWHEGARDLFCKRRMDALVKRGLLRCGLVCDEVYLFGDYEEHEGKQRQTYHITEKGREVAGEIRKRIGR